MVWRVLAQLTMINCRSVEHCPARNDFACASRALLGVPVSNSCGPLNGHLDWAQSAGLGCRICCCAVGWVSGNVWHAMKHIFKVVGVLFTLAQATGPLPVPGQLQAPPATGAAPNAAGPRIKFSETVFDFGRVNSSDIVRHDYFVTNTGNAVLEISDVRPGCPGCTTALPWDRQIQPGQAGKIPIQFKAAGFNGPVSKSVTVTCNDPAQATHALQFRANVWQPIEVQPAYVYFMPAEGETTNETKVVRIISHLEEPLTLSPPQCANPAFKLDLKTVQPGKEFALHVSYAGPVSNAPAQGYIMIGTSSTNVPTIKVNANAMPQPAIAVMPPQITLPVAALSAGFRHNQMIRNNGSAPMKVTQAAVNAEGVTVQVTESQPGKLFMLTVNFPTNFQARVGQPLELTVNTTHPRRPIIKVPIIQATAPAPALSRPQVLRPSVTAPAGAK